MKLRTVLVVGLQLLVAGLLVWQVTRDRPLDGDGAPDDRFKYG